MSSRSEYSLGSDPQELARLDRQAALLAPLTDMLLRAAGIGPRMRVLDLGTGLGHVATMVAGLVGPDGSVLGIDQADEAIAVAETRAAPNVRFERADARTFRDDAGFDAIVMRLLLYHLAEPAAFLRHHVSNLRDGGVMLAIDYDIRPGRTEPAVALVEDAFDWVVAAFHRAGANSRVGARLAPLLEEAGLSGVETIGLQGYLAPGDPVGPALLAGVVRALAPQIVAAGIATADEIGLEDLEQRAGAALREAGAVLLPPTIVGAWGRRGA